MKESNGFENIRQSANKMEQDYQAAEKSLKQLISQHGLPERVWENEFKPAIASFFTEEEQLTTSGKMNIVTAIENAEIWTELNPSIKAQFMLDFKNDFLY